MDQLFVDSRVDDCVYAGSSMASQEDLYQRNLAGKQTCRNQRPSTIGRWC